MTGRLKKRYEELKKKDWALVKEFVDADENFPIDVELTDIREGMVYQQPTEEYEGERVVPFSKSLEYFGKHAPDIVIRFISDIYFIRDLINVTVCAMTNHHYWQKMRDDSYGTPDTGYMGVTCEACGWSAGERLY